MHQVWSYTSDAFLWLALASLVFWRIGREAKHPHCRRCGYDMTAHATRPAPRTCPECGTKHAKARGLWRRTRSRWLKWALVVSLAGWYGCGVWPHVQRRGWRASVPTPLLVAFVDWVPPKQNRHCWCGYSPPTTFWGELNDRPIGPPWDTLLALRMRYFHPGTESGIQFAAIYVGDPLKQGLELAPTFQALPDWALDENEGSRYKMASNLWFVAPEPNRNYDYCFQGGWYFLRFESPATLELAQRVFKVMESARDPRGVPYIDPQDAASLKAYEQLAAAWIVVPPDTTTYSQIVRSVAEQAGIQVDPQLDAILEDFGQDDCASIPKPALGPEFLDHLELNQEDGTREALIIARKLWTISNGRLLFDPYGITDPKTGFFPMVHDVSGVVDITSQDPSAERNILVRGYVEDVLKGPPPEYFYPMDEAGLPPFAEPAGPSRLVLLAPPRVQYEFDQYISRRRAQRAAVANRSATLAHNDKP